MKKLKILFAVGAAVLSLQMPFFFQNKKQKEIQVGAEQIEKYRKLLKDRRVGLAANATSVIVRPDGTKIHDLDFLIQNRILW